LTFEFTPFAVISAIAACMAGFVALIASQKRNTPGGTSLTWLMLSVCIWSAGAALEYATVGIPGKITWAKFEYFGVVSCPVFFLLFAIEYNLLYRWLTRRNVMLLFVIPLITLGLALTNDWHGLIWNSFTPSPAHENLLVFGHGLGFWIGAVGYSYLCMLVGTILLIRSALRLQAAYRSQVFIIMAAALAPWFINLVYITKLSPLPGLEMTPLVILISGALFTWDIFGFHLLDLVPIARHVLIETMAEGIIVLDQQKRVVDVNPGAQRLSGEKTDLAIGSEVTEIFSAWPEMGKLFSQNNPETKIETTIADNRGGYIEVSISPIYDWRGWFRGQFVALRDVTERKNNQDEIQRMNESLRQKLAEIETLQAHLIELAIRDSLTGLFNRRYLDETLLHELSRARREEYPIGLMMIDLDHFKEINDAHGHKAGDQVLKSLAIFLIDEVRQGDIVCRFGGEEFLIILPRITQEAARVRAEEICQDFSMLPILYKNVTLHATISVGVAMFPRHGNDADEIICAADAAMYAAKEAGRNQVLSQN